MSNNRRNNRPPLKRTCLNEWKLRLVGPIQKGAEKPPMMAFNVINNQPRIDVYTGVPNDADGGRISAPMDTLVWGVFLTLLEEIADGPNDTQKQIVNRTGHPSEMVELSTTYIGKDNDGRVYLSIVALDRPRIKFVLRPSNYHSLGNKEGEPLSEAETSVKMAKSVVRIFEGLVNNVLDSNYVERSNLYNGSNHNESGYGNRAYEAPGYKRDDYKNGARPVANEEFAEDDIGF